MLILPIKKKWYDMILSGKKEEEYREIKPYWTKRLNKIFDFAPWDGYPIGTDYHKIMFRNGYGKNAPSFIAECTLDVGTGKEEWGAEKNKQYFVLTVHKILKEVKLIEKN